jgi:hypothetical protein
MTARAIVLAGDVQDLTVRQQLLDMLANTSRVAIWKILFYAVAFCINQLEQLQDSWSLEVDDRILQHKPHSARWYAEKAKEFQYGYALVAESDFYDNTALTEDQVNDSLLIKHSAVVEQDRGIRIKVAKEAGLNLAPLSVGELAAFKEYMEQVKDAGIKLNITSTVADDLKTKLRIYYNPLVLDENGVRNDGTDATPVQTALKNYLKGLPFNGLFVPQLAVDQLQAVDGVVIVKEDLWQARYGVLPFASIDVEYTPDSGYLVIDDADLELIFIPHAVI